MRNCSRVAICLTGQLARLELASKIHNLVIPHIGRGCEASLFVTISNAGNAGVKALYKQSHIKSGIAADKGANTGDSPIYEQYMEFGYVKWGYWSSMDAELTNSTVWTESNFAHVKQYHMTKYEYSFNMHIDMYTPPTIWGADGVLARRGSLFKKDAKRQAMRESLHLAQWSGMDRCIEVISTWEAAKGELFESVIRVRDDDMVIFKTIIPSVGIHDLATIGYLEWGGLHDNFYLAGRQVASCFFRAFFLNYFKEHDALFAVYPYNPERVALYYAWKCRARIKRLDGCQLPIFAIVFDYGGFVRIRAKTFAELAKSNHGRITVPGELFHNCTERKSLFTQLIQSQFNLSNTGGGPPRTALQDIIDQLHNFTRSDAAAYPHDHNNEKMVEDGGASFERLHPHDPHDGWCHFVFV